ncbi:MAG: WYL domain-containing protein [Deltaproteobacteria bacterium]|nr:WYL domain-containing protein [Deltaproteobacteria bacterium]
MPRSSSSKKLPRDIVLLQLALVLLQGGRLNYAHLVNEYGLQRRTAERYIVNLREAGLPVVSVRVGYEVEFALHHMRTRMNIEAVDVSEGAAKSLSLLLVAAALLPRNLGVREAVDTTVRAALRLRGLKMAGEMRRLEDAIIVLENEAKDYTGREEIFESLFDAVLDGRLVEIDYTSPRSGPERRRVHPATIGLYKGGLYVLGVDVGDDGSNARWWAIERLDEVPVVVGEARLPMAVRLKALESAKRRWGPARAASSSSSSSSSEQLVTLHFSAQAAPYVRARPWHTAVDAEVWSDGGLRVSVRLSGETLMFESWLLSWGAQVQVLRPRSLAARLADELERAAAGHREAAAAFARDVLDEP